MIIINKSDTYLDSNGIEVKYASPVLRWKDFIGPKDPSAAKTTHPNSLRAIYGTDIIRNEFWGSDNASDAYRELSNFMLPLPCRAPLFTFDPNKLKLETIMNFLFPVKPNHPDVSGRLDIFAKYGPVNDYHVLDTCICKECRPIIKDILKKTGKTLKNNKDKIITDEFINRHRQYFCINCLLHFNSWSHLFSGMEQTHILTNEEINFLIFEMNKEDLFTILKSEKGSCAETVISKIDLKIMPEEIHYTKQHVEKLLKVADVDFYDRFDFYELQNLINEDRRIRLNFWVHKIIGKPPSAFKNPKLINTGQFSSEDIKDIHNLKSKNFSLLRTLPIKVSNEKEEKLKTYILEHPVFLKEKLSGQEVNQKIEKLLSNNLYKIAGTEDHNNTGVVNNMILLRNYNLETMKHLKQKEELKKLLKKK
jgi:hypothetical protein